MDYSKIRIIDGAATEKRLKKEANKKMSILQISNRIWIHKNCNILFMAISFQWFLFGLCLMGLTWKPFITITFIFIEVVMYFNYKKIKELL